jgi:predicted metal-dependent peptidase
LVVNVAVFVDNSGSMGEREISYLLTQIRAIMKVYEAKLTVYSFDTQVHAQEAYEVKQATQIRFERIGGGGTRFQSIFDFLHQQHATNNDTLAVILTDGWGEAKLEPYRFSNVLWVLTTERSELSVTNLQTRVASLADDPNYQKIKTTN